VGRTRSQRKTTTGAGRPWPGLVQLADAGRKLPLVTGGELEDLSARFQQLGLFELVVAENGMLLDGLADRPPTQVSEDLTGAINVGALLVCAPVASVLSAEHVGIRLPPEGNPSRDHAWQPATRVRRPS
jgi:hypothetical protein